MFLQTKKCSKIRLKTQKIEKSNFCTLFLKKAIFRQLQNNWAPKETQNDDWAQKSPERVENHLGPDNTPKNKPTLDHKLGPDNNFTAYISIYIYIYIYMCCEVIIWAKFGHFRCHYLGQVGVIIWAKLFLAYKIVVSSDCWHTQLSFCVFFVPNYLAII